jgi:hypothetical protein
MPQPVKCRHCGLVQSGPPNTPCNRCRMPLGNDRTNWPAAARQSDNPYQAPTAQVTRVDGPLDREQLRGIARGQRLVIYSVLAQFGLFGLLFGAEALLPHAALTVLMLVWVLGTMVMSIYGQIVLSRQLYGTGTAVVHFFLSMFLGFLLLLYLSSQANQRFKKAGIRVGLLGVPDSAFD